MPYHFEQHLIAEVIVMLYGISNSLYLWVRATLSVRLLKGIRNLHTIKIRCSPGE